MTRPKHPVITKPERARLDAMAKEVVMIRAGAAKVVERKGKAVRVMWWGACEWCRKVCWLQWCHVLARSVAAGLVWEPLNAWAGCYRCHRFRWHVDPDSAVAFIRRLRGLEIFRRLRYLNAKPRLSFAHHRQRLLAARMRLVAK